MHFLLFLNKCIVLCDALECELFHQVDDIGLAQKLVFKLLHGDGKCGRVEQDLALGARVSDQLLNHRLKLF